MLIPNNEHNILKFWNFLIFPEKKKVSNCTVQEPVYKRNYFLIDQRGTPKSLEKYAVAHPNFKMICTNGEFSITVSLHNFMIISFILQKSSDSIAANLLFFFLLQMLSCKLNWILPKSSLIFYETHIYTVGTHWLQLLGSTLWKKKKK